MEMQFRVRKVLVEIVYWALLILGLLFFAFPLFWMVRSSLMDWQSYRQMPIIWFPTKPTLENFIQIWMWSGNLLEALFNSIFIGTIIMAGNVLINSMAGYGFARIEFPGRQAIFAVFMSTTMVGFEILMIPRFLIVRGLGLYDRFGGVVLPGIAAIYSIFMMRQFFATIPYEIEESAFMDGASRLRIFFNIMMPMAKPALATIAVLHFLGGWNMYLWPLIVTKPTGQIPLIQTLIATQSRRVGTDVVGSVGLNWPGLMAASLIASIPILALFFFAQRWFIRGLTGAAVKG